MLARMCALHPERRGPEHVWTCRGRTTCAQSGAWDPERRAARRRAHGLARWLALGLALWLVGGVLPLRAEVPPDARPVVRVGTSGDYAPFSEDSPDGTLDGFDIDIARQMASDLGYRIEWVRFAWPTLADDVRAGRIDVAMSGVTWQPERAVVGYMTRAVAIGGPCVIGASEPRTRTVAVNRGGVLERFARTRYPAERLRAIDDNRSLPGLLFEGAVDAIVTDSFERAAFERRLADLRDGAAAAAVDHTRGGVRPGSGQGGASERGYTTVCEPSRARKVYWVGPGVASTLGPALDGWLARHEAEVSRLRREHLGDAGAWSEADHLVDLIARRLALMPAVAAWKRARGAPIEDVAREREVLEAAAASAAAHGLPEHEATALLARLIELAKEVQARAPDAAPSLDVPTELRPELLRLGDRILAALADLRAASAASTPAKSLLASAIARLDVLLLPEERAGLERAIVAVWRAPEVQEPSERD
jgi:cyclohexadienyl dehydratase